ncbi:UNVERIFIED_CONTAM: hypothetical protein PYX00_006114 [Menopon gallinae]|uniref:Translation factor GUF1 homolog, mitochondrial n=1 Tax=Menopon gallinae TaxID=328185 RepID=A0AAW2HUB6_9NEOP
MISFPFRIVLKLRFAPTSNRVINLSSKNYERNIWLKLPYRQCSSQADVPVEHIRNFCIIAHVDHGKSTLADRILEITGAIPKDKGNKQVLDRLPVERERGITVKAVAASLRYPYKGTEYHLNLIDTPGHVDFSNEVSRSLSASQGVILLVSANEGIQAQTVSNFYLAFEKDLTIIPVLNKIDLPNANPDLVAADLYSAFDIEPSTVKYVSAKTGQGVKELLESIIELIPPPKVNREEPFKSLIIDSWYENYRGSVLFVYVSGGEVRVGNEITSYKNKKNYQVKTVAKLCPEETPVQVLRAGEVGIITCNMKNSKEAVVGDTLFEKGKDVGSIPPISNARAMVFAGMFSRNEKEREQLSYALDKLLLNDPSVTVNRETSPVLGSGWRLGFLGYLHMDVFRQRLEEEFDEDIILTAPSVTYKFKIKGEKHIKMYGGEEVAVSNPIKYPERTAIAEMYEPMILATIISPLEYSQIVFDECLARRGEEKESSSLSNSRTIMKFLMPLSEVILDFHDRLKSITSGFATYDYEDAGYALTKLSKLTVLLNGKEVEELAQIVHSSRATEVGRKLALKLKEFVPRQLISIAIQVVVDGKVVAREDIKPYRKDVTAKLYGGDITRAQKLLRAQAEGKKKMREIGKVRIHRDTFINVLKQG